MIGFFYLNNFINLAVKAKLNNMKIILIGANGTIGKRIDEGLASRHQIIRASAHHGDIRVAIVAVLTFCRYLDRTPGR